MDVSAASAATLTDLQAQAALLVLRKAQDLAASSAAQLIEALPTPPVAPAADATVGRHIDLFV